MKFDKVIPNFIFKSISVPTCSAQYDFSFAKTKSRKVKKSSKLYAKKYPDPIEPLFGKKFHPPMKRRCQSPNRSFLQKSTRIIQGAWRFRT